jgi:pimeloyl-ACP methyl ester carboxylesterase
MLPGAVLPAALAYPALITALGDGVHVVAKELEVYADSEPPRRYGLNTEVNGIAREADAAGFERFHLVGYSGGGASSLAFASTYPDRLLSLSLLEPAWAGNEGLGAHEQGVWSELDAIMHLPPEQRMPAFVRAQLADGVPLPAPPDGPPPSWMAARPAGLVAFVDAFRRFRLDLDRLRAFDRPVYYAVGSLSNPDYYARQADRLAMIFPDFSIEVFEGRHHFDPPHRVEPDRLAASLIQLWARAETV